MSQSHFIVAVFRRDSLNQLIQGVTLSSSGVNDESSISDFNIHLGSLVYLNFLGEVLWNLNREIIIPLFNRCRHG